MKTATTAAPDLITAVLENATDQLALGLSRIDHNIALRLLLKAYFKLAIAHPCCTECASKSCAMISVSLRAHADSGPPPGTRTH